jgi:hypothetical protein
MKGGSRPPGAMAKPARSASSILSDGIIKNWRVASLRMPEPNKMVYIYRKNYLKEWGCQFFTGFWDGKCWRNANGLKIQSCLAPTLWAEKEAA